ncbi:seminal metalloprotease 1-like [Calliphora vicina]|uniref:seminal metalloprotease 1-like n=1 Tax=Calliphora vicina TaxID=7373 RepID=UPI00325B362F
MKYYPTFLLIGVLIANCYALPVVLEDVYEYPEVMSGYFEGDMDIELTRNGDISESKRWPDGIVYYKISDDYDDDHVEYIKGAMQAIESASCVKFRPAKDNMTAFLDINGNKPGCSATVGYIGRRQYLNLRATRLGTACFQNGTIIHEMLHTLAFYHQHNVPNRDDYIRIVEENMNESNLKFYNKYKEEDITDFGVEYDYDSIMHYHATANSNNGKKTIVPLKDENIAIGQRRGLSDGDIEKLNAMYNCDDKRAVF